jgi:hypothetical protein
MAPAVREHPGARPIRRSLMDTTSVAYVLCRIEDDASTTAVSHHDSIVEGIQAGQLVVQTEDFDFAYTLHSNGTRLATFGEGRIGYREWARRSGYIHSIDDKYDHDVDELMA